MPRASTTLRPALTRFLRGNDGMLVTEFVLVLPIFLFLMFGLYSYWDAFRALNTAEKAAYAVSDLISRETRTMTPHQIDGLHDVMEYMIGSDLPVKMRVTSITYSGVRQRYEVIWSRSPGGQRPQLTTTSLQTLVPRLPLVGDGESLILMEALVQFTPSIGPVPAFNMFMDDTEFELFIPTRPRFLSKVCLQGVACG